MAQWVIHREPNGFPLERAQLGECDLCVAYVEGEWQWLVRRDGHDLAEGTSRAAQAARQQAEAVAYRRLAAPVFPCAA